MLYTHLKFLIFIFSLFTSFCSSQISNIKLKKIEHHIDSISTCNCIYTSHPRYEGRSVRFSHYVIKGVKRKHMKLFADRPLKLSKRYLVSPRTIKAELISWCETPKYKLMEVKITYTDFDDYFGVILFFEPKKR